MSYIIEVEEDNNGDFFITFPEELMEEVGWKEGDLLNWDLHGEGVILTKVNDPSEYEMLED
jgi:bifunctional DNA-binding transcriptional regulator/antitoxin component of YhaV-PrlF toxin-antitoxin module